MPRVTVLLPVYNAARYVGDAVRSVLAQTFGDFELLVIDDGSTDASAEVVQSYSDSRIRFVRNERNLGLTPTLNRGLSLARGELVARQDADDLSEPDRLAGQVTFLDEHADTAVVGTWYRKIDADGRITADRRLPVRDAALRWAMLSYCPIVHSAAMFRRHAVMALGGYDERFVYAQDYDLWSRVARRHCVANVPASLVRYRVLPSSLTATIGESSGEGPAVSLSNVTALAVASGRTPPTPPDHAAACALLFGGPIALGSPPLAEAFVSVWVLLAAFLAQPGIGTVDAEAVRADVTAFLRRRFLELLGQLSADDAERVGNLLYGGARWTRLLNAAPIRSALAAVGRSRFASALARPRSEP
jgi:glycosyl transferase family 2